MPTIKLQKFLGEVKRTASELLPSTAGQEVSNVKLYSGDLLPYSHPVVVDTTYRYGVTKTIHALRNSDTDEILWLSWEEDVDIVPSTFDTQRFYYTGDGIPKVSDYTLATKGSSPYPAEGGYYELGLPLPDSELNVSFSPIDAVFAEFYERDAAGISTFFGKTNHGFATGNIVTIYNSYLADKSFDLKNVSVTVINDTDFFYFNPGDIVSKTSTIVHNGTTYTIKTAARISGNTQVRNYIYTWVTPWDEESIPSTPSDSIFIKEGQAVTVTNLPETRPSGRNFIRGIRLYRNVTSLSISEYLSLGTLWFPTSTVSMLRASGVVTVTFEYPHNFILLDKFKLYGCTDTSFDIEGGVVLEVIDRYTFSYTQSGTDVSEVSDTAGTVYHNIAQFSDDPEVYWGFSDYKFLDNFLVTSLGAVVASEDYDPPPKDLQGIKLAHNNVVVGFSGRELYFSEPNNYHAWPEKYRKTFEFEIVAVEAVEGFIIVLTTRYPYLIQGSDPAVVSVTRMATSYPCLSKRSVVTTETGVTWATHGGLASYSSQTGVVFITRQAQDWDTWGKGLDPATITGQYYENKYFGSHSTGSFIFEQNAGEVGSYVSISYKFSAAYTDTLTGILYYVEGTTGDVYEWDNDMQIVSPLEWKSKTFVVPQPTNMGAARVVAEYSANDANTTAIIEYNSTVAAYNENIWANNSQLGTINSSVLNHHPINAGIPVRSLLPVHVSIPLIFKLWVDRELIFQTELDSDNMFRLPSGYKSDTFEFGVSGSARVKYIEISETPSSLRDA